MLELPVENNKHINFEWSGAGRGRGGGGGIGLFCYLKLPHMTTMSQKFFRLLYIFFVDWNISGPGIIIKNTKNINKLFLS